MSHMKQRKGKICQKFKWGRQNVVFKSRCKERGRYSYSYSTNEAWSRLNFAATNSTLSADIWLTTQVPAQKVLKVIMQAIWTRSVKTVSKLAWLQCYCFCWVPGWYMISLWSLRDKFGFYLLICTERSEVRVSTWKALNKLLKTFGVWQSSALWFRFGS